MQSAWSQMKRNHLCIALYVISPVWLHVMFSIFLEKWFLTEIVGYLNTMNHWNSGSCNGGTKSVELSPFTLAICQNTIHSFEQKLVFVILRILENFDEYRPRSEFDFLVLFPPFETLLISRVLLLHFLYSPLLPSDQSFVDSNKYSSASALQGLAFSWSMFVTSLSYPKYLLSINTPIYSSIHSSIYLFIYLPSESITYWYSSYLNTSTVKKFKCRTTHI